MIESGEPIAKIARAPDRLRDEIGERHLTGTAIFILKINQQVLRHHAGVHRRMEAASAYAAPKGGREDIGPRPLARQFCA